MRIPAVPSIVGDGFILGHFFMVWDGRFAWGSGPSGAPDPAAACPYPFCGIWILR